MVIAMMVIKAGNRNHIPGNSSPAAVSSLKLSVFTGCMSNLRPSEHQRIAHFSVWFFLNECNEERFWRSRENWTIKQWMDLIFSEGCANVV
jgi:hypothetical protein